jgi:hypothetical protein
MTIPTLATVEYVTPQCLMCLLLLMLLLRWWWRWVIVTNCFTASISTSRLPRLCNLPSPCPVIPCMPPPPPRSSFSYRPLPLTIIYPSCLPQFSSGAGNRNGNGPPYRPSQLLPGSVAGGSSDAPYLPFRNPTQAMDQTPPTTPTFVEATFPDYSSARAYCQARFDGGLCGLDDLVRYARAGYVNCNFGFIEAPSNDSKRGGWVWYTCARTTTVLVVAS